MTTTESPTPEQVLALPLDPERHGATTIRHYLVQLLAALWDEGSDFSAKRPLGNSDWQWPIYAELVRAGFVTGRFDADGDLDVVDHQVADQLVADAIATLAGPEGA